MTLEAKVDFLLQEIASLKAIVKPVIGMDMSREEAMAELGYNSSQENAFFQFCARTGLKPYRRRHYRRADVLNAQARASLPKKRRAA